MRNFKSTIVSIQRNIIRHYYNNMLFRVVETRSLLDLRSVNPLQMSLSEDHENSRSIRARNGEVICRDSIALAFLVYYSQTSIGNSQLSIARVSYWE